MIEQRWKIIKYERKTDKRGWMDWVIKENIKIKNPFHQIRLITIAPGEVRGNSYHENYTEWFCSINGLGLLRLKDVKSGKKLQLPFGSNNMVAIKILPKVAHSLKNICSDTLFFLILVEGAFDFNAEGKVKDEIKYRLFGEQADDLFEGYEEHNNED